MLRKKSQSPVPNKLSVLKVEQAEISFSEAINAIIGGLKVRRTEWSDVDEYCLLKDNFLMIHRNNKFHTWIISEGDMMATDWTLVK